MPWAIIKFPINFSAYMGISRLRYRYGTCKFGIYISHDDDELIPVTHLRPWSQYVQCNTFKRSAGKELLGDLEVSVVYTRFAPLRASVD